MTSEEYFELVNSNKLRPFNEARREKTVKKVIDIIVHLKKETDFYNSDEREWCSMSLMYGVIGDVDGFLQDWEMTIIAIESSKILAEKYNIYGCD